MAHRLMLPNKPHGLPWMWNIDAHVGDYATLANRPTDVELVKLIVMAMAFNGPNSTRHPHSNSPSLVLNGRFDQTLAYYILRTQMAFKMHTIDGIVSPIGHSGNPMTWILANWNWRMWQQNRVHWENLDKSPQLSAALLTELQRKV